jgi:hypothetical protein
MKKQEYKLMALAGIALAGMGYWVTLLESNEAGAVIIGIGCLLILSAIVGAMWNQN